MFIGDPSGVGFHCLLVWGMERVYLALILDSVLLPVLTNSSQCQLFTQWMLGFFISYSSMKDLVPFMLKHQNVLQEMCRREMGGGRGRRDDAKEQFPVLVNELNPRIRKSSKWKLKMSDNFKSRIMIIYKM